MSLIIVFSFNLGIEKIREQFFSNNEKTVLEEISKVEDSNKNLDSVTTGIEDDNMNSQEENNDLEDDEIILDEIIDNVDGTNTNDINGEFEWYIEIPKIKLYAPIEEGTNEDILNRSVGHFEDTSRRNGNCGLAAHNRGYRVNYFARLKELKNGDIVNYFVDGKKYKYKINQITIIYETDWSMLEDTDENKITLITCIENRDEYRLCVQGILIE